MSSRDVIACVPRETTNVKPELQWRPQGVGDTMRYLPRRRVPTEGVEPTQQRKRAVTHKKTGCLELSKPFDSRHGAR